MHAYRMNKCGNTTFKAVLDYIENRMNDNDGGVFSEKIYSNGLNNEGAFGSFRSPSGQIITSNSYSEPKSFQFFYDLIKAYDGYTSYLATGEIYEVFTLIQRKESYEGSDINGSYVVNTYYYDFTVERYHYRTEERHDCCD